MRGNLLPILYMRMARTLERARAIAKRTAICIHIVMLNLFQHPRPGFARRTSGDREDRPWPLKQVQGDEKKGGSPDFGSDAGDRRDFRREIAFFLLDAFAELEAGETLERDRRADILAGSGNDFGDRGLAIHHEQL